MDLKSLKTLDYSGTGREKGRQTVGLIQDWGFARQVKQKERRLRECLQENVYDGLCRIKDLPGWSDNKSGECPRGKKKWAGTESEQIGSVLRAKLFAVCFTASS